MQVSPVRSDELWRQAPVDLGLSSMRIDVWRTALDAPQAVLSAFEGLLSDQERARAQRFKIISKRNEYLLCRGLLRSILGRQLGEDPRAFDFQYGPQGKPFLTESWRGSTVSFNVSHTRGLALIAVAAGRALGVDVEALTPRVHAVELARRFFAPGEVRALLEFPVAERREAFFRCWTRKEAFLKATARGISLGLDQFEVSLDPRETSALRATHGDPREAARWSLVDLDAGPGFAAALAVEGHGHDVACWEADLPSGRKSAALG